MAKNSPQNFCLGTYMQTAHNEGEKIGFEKGREAARADMVLRLHHNEKSIAEIADLTDLPLEIVQAIVH